MVCLNIVLGVLASVIYYLGLGKLWYTHFGTEWRTIHHAQKGPHPHALYVMAGAALLTTLIVACFITRLYITSVIGGVLFGAMAAAAFSLPPVVNGVLYQNKNLRIILIDGGFEVLAVVGVSAIIALLH